jgi:hypothetical protein
VQGVAHRGLLLRVERAHGAHQSFERIAGNYFMTFVRQAERDAGARLVIATPLTGSLPVICGSSPRSPGAIAATVCR